MAGDDHSEQGVAADAASSASDALLIVGDADTVCWANAAANSLLGVEDLIGHDLSLLIGLPAGRSLLELRTTTPHRILGTIPDGTPDPLEVELSIAPVTDRDEQWVVTLLPMPRNNLSIRELLRRANEDRLTGLDNRSHFIEQVDTAFRDGTTAPADYPYALVMLDLDGFKRINDTWGHEAGDAVLVQVGDRIRNACRDADVVARLGGDEFAIWCRRLATDDTKSFLERIRGVFDQPVQVGDLALSIAGSIGCTTTEVPRNSLELMREADMAMYDAKGRGVGLICVFDEQMRADARRRITLERELRRAVPTDAMQLAYQPILRVHDGVVVGAEALVRWEHARLGTLPPREFFPILDSAALRADLDTALIPRTIEQLAAWNQDRRVPLSGWVNLSPVSVALPVIEAIGQALDDHAVSGEHLVVELGESSSLHGVESTAALELLRDLGVRLALDNFGLGHAQIDLIPQLELDYVKLDRSFVQGIADNATRRTLCRSVINLAQALGTRIVAEGIEEERDLIAVAELGADLVQGFHLARPGRVGSILGVDDLDATIDLRPSSGLGGGHTPNPIPPHSSS
ncbi:MAG: EAL domain-containing protein [Actinomycetota bacterium]